MYRYVRLMLSRNVLRRLQDVIAGPLTGEEKLRIPSILIDFDARA